MDRTLTAATTGEPRTIRCPACGREFTMAAFYPGKLTVACPWCLAPVKAP